MPDGFNTWDTFATDQLLSDEKWELLVREVMEEVILIARELGMNISSTFADQQIEMTREMGNYRPSTLVDFEAGKPLELNSMFLEPLMVGQTVGLELPRLSALCHVLEQMNPREEKPGA